jgi:hypothetical protein
MQVHAEEEAKWIGNVKRGKNWTYAIEFFITNFANTWQTEDGSRTLLKKAWIQNGLRTEFSF